MKIVERRVVAIEGKQTNDRRLILPGAIKMKKDSIPVMGTRYTEMIGKATDFERNDETGEISLNIFTYDILHEDLNIHITLYNLICDEPYDDMSMVITSGNLIGLFVSIGDSAWPELNRKKEQ